MGRPKGSKSNPDRRQPFKQSDIERALRAARTQGIVISRIDIEPRTGKISLVPSTVPTDVDADTNPWDKAVVK